MRHRMGIRKFGRDPKHRKAMLRNLATNLVLHERITTTMAKAKEMRSLIEKVVHKAKQGDYQGNVFLNNTLFTKKAIDTAKKTLAPRYENQVGGFTRIKYLGTRRGDRARMCYIELVKNPIEVYEKNALAQEKANLGIASFWEWELRVLRQEQDYFKSQQQTLQQKIDSEIEAALTRDQQATANATIGTQIRQEVEGKFKKQQKYIEESLKRAQFEEQIHLKQKKSNKYERLFQQYAMPMDFANAREAKVM